MKPLLPSLPSAVPGLRRLAELRIRSPRKGAPGPGTTDPKSAADSARLLHELQVHQVEFEMQNSELQEGRNRLELLVEKYTDLYDFAPIGYFTLDEHRRILDANLMGSAILGVERSRLLGEDLARFVGRTSLPAFRNFLAQAAAGVGRQVCELTLRKHGGATFWANLHGAPFAAPYGEHRWCRVAVSDITSLVEAREAAQRVEALRAVNLDLKREIARRQAIEEELKCSQKEQNRLLRQAQSMHLQLRHVSHQILRAQEEERKRISRELHDDISQTLVSINVQLETLARASSVDPLTLRTRITATQRRVEASIERVREFARELRPAMLDDLGLIPALHSYLEEFIRRTGVRVRFKTFAGVERLNSDCRTALYRVAQSALINVAKHADASQVKVNIRQLPGGAVCMDITDNGRSFDVERFMHAKRSRHLGLIGMRERSEMVGGTLTVTSAPGEGTTVRLEIPCTP